ALVVAGDLFDGRNPPAQAQEQLYRFLVDLRARRPSIDVVLVGGNHDSAQRLDAPGSMMRALGIHMVGGLPRRADRSLDVDALLVPLTDARGAVAAWVAAVPFLRLADLPSTDGDDPLVEGVRAVYAEALDAARAKRQPGQALVATGHCYMRDGELSELSERKILGGNQHALPVGVFPEDVAYVALGHLHLAQPIGRPGVRYSGSPLPLSMPERTYPHQVCVVKLDGERLAEVRPARVPRVTDLLRVPESGALPLPCCGVTSRRGRARRPRSRPHRERGSEDAVRWTGHPLPGPSSHVAAQLRERHEPASESTVHPLLDRPVPGQRDLRPKPDLAPALVARCVESPGHLQLHVVARRAREHARRAAGGMERVVQRLGRWRAEEEVVARRGDGGAARTGHGAGDLHHGDGAEGEQLAHAG
ncbi:MAG: exonuclease SbcCD subunit D, partial [Myxococcota bacterium]